VKIMSELNLPYPRKIGKLHSFRCCMFDPRNGVHFYFKHSCLLRSIYRPKFQFFPFPSSLKAHCCLGCISFTLFNFNFHFIFHFPIPFTFSPFSHFHPSSHIGRCSPRGFISQYIYPWIPAC
jgi:hypothetical protein